LYNQALFVNNYVDGRSFDILFDPKIQALKIHGELGYHIQEKFSFIGAINLNEYTNLANYDKAYGLTPMEITGTLKWKISKDLQVKVDAFFRDGTSYQNKLLQSQKLDPAADLNLGAEFSVMPRLNLWIQMNNLFNNKYQRWNQYEVLGFNVLGGVVYSFK
jgi:outer membrane receptor for ferrienterochelin and colicin